MRGIANAKRVLTGPEKEDQVRKKVVALRHEMVIFLLIFKVNATQIHDSIQIQKGVP